MVENTMNEVRMVDVAEMDEEAFSAAVCGAPQVVLDRVQLPEK